MPENSSRRHGCPVIWYSTRISESSHPDLDMRPDYGPRDKKTGVSEAVVTDANERSCADSEEMTDSQGGRLSLGSLNLLGGNEQGLRSERCEGSLSGGSQKQGIL